MTVIRPNSVSGITSITAQANEINFFRSNGALAGLQLNGVNFNTTTGVSTFNNLNVGGVLTYQDVTNVDSIGIITARSTIDAQGDVSIADKIIHTGDTNTAIRFPVGDVISAETNGAERLRITSAGTLLLGTSTGALANGNGIVIADATAARLSLKDTTNGVTGTDGFDVVQTGTDAYLYHRENGNMIFGTNATERLRITSSGKLLIGTTTPGYNDLDDLTISTSGNTGITIRSGTSNLGVIGFADGTSGNAQYRGVIQYSHSGDYMQFNTADAERLRILSTGELGVNTTAPVEKLGISGNMRFVNPTGTTSRITALPSGSYNTGTSGGSAICFQRFSDGGGGSDEIFFETHWQGNRHGESMRINKYGHVTTPNQPSFNVTIGGGQINSNVGVIVFTDTTTRNNHNTGNHYSTSTGRFTAPVAGRYQINARMLTNSSTQSYTIYLLRVNTNHHGYIGHNHSDFWFMESGSWVLNLQANDYVDCFLQVHSGHGGFNYASFSGFLIG